MNKRKILLIEDDRPLAWIVSSLLESAFSVRVAHSGRTGLQEIRAEPPDLILLDLSLPDMDGHHVLSEIRTFSNTPVMFVSGKGSDRDKVDALEQGADDYITKPFHNDELLARISALLRRVQWTPPSATLLEVGQVRMDAARRHVTVAGTTVHLTPNEFAILSILMRQPGKTVTYSELVQSVWGNTYSGDCAVLRVNISRLRQKIEANPRAPRYIQTVPRQGYRMPGP